MTMFIHYDSTHALFFIFNGKYQCKMMKLKSNAISHCFALDQHVAFHSFAFFSVKLFPLRFAYRYYSPCLCRMMTICA